MYSNSKTAWSWGALKSAPKIRPRAQHAGSEPPASAAGTARCVPQPPPLLTRSTCGVSSTTRGSSQHHGSALQQDFSGGTSSVSQITLGKVRGGWRQARGSDAQGQGERQRAQSRAQEALSEHQHMLLCRGGDGAAAQVAPRGRESFLGPASSLLNVVLGSVRWVALLEQGGTGWPPGVPSNLKHSDPATLLLAGTSQPGPSVGRAPLSSLPSQVLRAGRCCRKR